METALASACGALLLVAAGLKLRDRTASAVALSTYGVAGRAAPIVVSIVAGIELVLAGGLLAGERLAAAAAALMLAAMAGAQALAIASGRTGLPCGCLGGRGRLGAFSILRAAVPAVACGWLAVAGFPAAAAPSRLLVAGVVAGAAAAILLLGPVRPSGALEIAAEGPPLGAPTPLSQWLPAADGRIRIAVFTAASCSLCRTLGPSLEALVEQGDVVLRTYEQEREREVWQAVPVPGAPYAVAVGADGTVLAKGTVNDGRQLRSIIEAARGRAGEHGRPDHTVSSRRELIAQAAVVGGAVAVAPTVAQLVGPEEAAAFHFCGHIYTTDSCPHPTGLPRVDARGRPVRGADGAPVDDLGRLIDGDGLPIGQDRRPLLDPDGRRLPPAPRTPVCAEVSRRYGFPTQIDGAWYRCCNGHVRKLVDCCADHGKRINGDGALTGYCYGGRKVFCVTYHQTKVPC